jgi:hypothetical protein
MLILAVYYVESHLHVISNLIYISLQLLLYPQSEVDFLIFSIEVLPWHSPECPGIKDTPRPLLHHTISNGFRYFLVFFEANAGLVLSFPRPSFPALTDSLLMELET